jgi:hypothetical protein
MSNNQNIKINNFNDLENIQFVEYLNWSVDIPIFILNEDCKSKIP